MKKPALLTLCLISVLVAFGSAHAQQWTGRFSEPIHTTANTPGATVISASGCESTLENAPGGSTYLLNAGTCSFAVLTLDNITVYPNNGAAVTFDGSGSHTLQLGSNVTIAGVCVQAKDSTRCITVNGSNVEVRNSRILGGEAGDCVRAESGNDIRFIGNVINGGAGPSGVNGHTFHCRGEGTSTTPTNVLLKNNHLYKDAVEIGWSDWGSGSEDSLQTRSCGDIIVEGNWFAGQLNDGQDDAEEIIDLKELRDNHQLIFRYNFIDARNHKSGKGCMISQTESDHASNSNIIDINSYGNVFFACDEGPASSGVLFSASDTKPNEVHGNWDFNLMVQVGDADRNIAYREFSQARARHNTLVNGQLVFRSGAGSEPENNFISYSSNLHFSLGSIDNSEFNGSCSHNNLSSSGGSLHGSCSNTTTAQPNFAGSCIGSSTALDCTPTGTTFLSQLGSDGFTKGVLIPPTIQSAEIGSIASNVVTLNMKLFFASGYLHDTRPVKAVQTGQITVEYNGTPQSVSGSQVVNQTQIRLTMAQPASGGQTVTFAATGGWCQDSSSLGNALDVIGHEINAKCAAVSEFTIENNVTGAPDPDHTVDGVVLALGEVNLHHNIIRNNALSLPANASVLRMREHGDLVQNNVIYGNTFGGNFIRTSSVGAGPDTEISDNVFCSNSDNTIAAGFNVHDNTFTTGTPSPGCTAKENEILGLRGEEPPPPDPGLIAHWTFDNTLVDAQGNADLTVGGGAVTPTYVSGLSGSAIEFGGDEFATTVKHSILGTELFPVAGNPFSVSAFFKTDEPVSGTIIASAVAAEADRDFQIFLQNNTLDTYMRGVRTVSPEVYNDGAWHHVAVTWDGTTASYYIDGAFISTMTVGGSGEDTGEHIIIGARTGGTGFFFTGTIDEVKIYNTAINAQDVNELADLLPTGPSDITSGLIAHWTFDNTLTDSSPAGGTDLTHSDTPAYETGQIGNALTLDGTEFATTGTHAVQGTRLFPIAGNPFSVSVWHKTTSSGTPIASAVPTTAERDFQIAQSGTGALDVFLRGAQSRQEGNFNDGGWHHTVVTWDGSIARIYIDGLLRFANAGVGSSAEDTGEDIVIGAHTGGTGFPLTGSVDDARLYNRALGGDDVNALFTLQPGEPEATPPSVPNCVEVLQVSSEQLALSWSPSIDDSGGTITYRIESCDGFLCNDFAEIGTTTATQFAATGLTPGTVYRFRLRAEDPSLNLSGYSVIVEESTLPPARRAEHEGGTVSGGFFQ